MKQISNKFVQKLVKITVFGEKGNPYSEYFHHF